MSEQLTAEDIKRLTETRKNDLMKEVQEAAAQVDEQTIRLRTAVDELRTLSNTTWKEIGALLGISGPAAFQRYGK